jgi:hypothetical protein
MSLHVIESVSAARRTNRECLIFQIRRDMLRRHEGIGWLFILQRPLLFGAINLSEIIDAGV